MRMHLQVSDIGALIATALIIAIGTYLVGKKLMGIARLRETLELIAVGSVMASLGWLIARIHLHIFDPIFLKSGSLDTFKKTL